MYKIELRYAFCWDDANWTEELNDGPVPMRFPSIELAQAAVDEFLDDVRNAVAEGHTDIEELPENYRIVKAA